VTVWKRTLGVGDEGSRMLITVGVGIGRSRERRRLPRVQISVVVKRGKMSSDWIEEMDFICCA
jgi:hypothetical protein